MFNRFKCTLIVLEVQATEDGRRAILLSPERQGLPRIRSTGELTPSGIAHRSGQGVVRHQAAHVPNARGFRAEVFDDGSVVSKARIPFNSAGIVNGF
jgi:hypothetical protein